MATSGFHLWQFQVFNCGAEGLVVVLFWLDLWEIFFLATPGFELGTSGSLVLHSTTVPQWLLVFTSDNFRYLTLVQMGLVVVFFWLDLWEIFFLATPRFEPGTSGSLVLSLYHCATVTSGFHFWQFQVFNCGAEGLVVVLFWLDLWEIFFLATPGFELGTSGSLVLHSTTVSPWQLLVFTSDNFRYLTVVQRDWWWYCSDWICERFCFWPHQGLNRDLWISCPALYHCAMAMTPVFHLWQFQVFNCGAEGYGGGIVLIGPVRDFLFGHTRVWTGHLWISCPALYHCTIVTSVFHLWQFQVFNCQVQRDWWWYCSDWICERFSFWPHQGLKLGTSGSLVLHSTTAPWQLLVFSSDNF